MNTVPFYFFLIICHIEKKTGLESFPAITDYLTAFLSLRRLGFPAIFLALLVQRAETSCSILRKTYLQTLFQPCNVFLCLNILFLQLTALILENYYRSSA